MSDYLPQEILVEILHSLPPKSIVKCTAVCKSWRSLITDPYFINDHLHRSQKDNNQFLLLQLCDQRVHPNAWRAPLAFSLRYDNEMLDEFSTLDLPRSSIEHEFYVVGMCNGLVCITIGIECYTLVLCNPCIRRYVSLPKPSDYRALYKACIGFGFDSRTNDYKVVRIVSMMDDDRYGLCPPNVDLYSLATGLWKSITAAVPTCTICFTGGDAPHAFMNGIVHWAARRRVNDDWYNFILSFDLGNEAFDEVMLPKCLAFASSDNVTVIGGGKCLTVYHEVRSPCSSNIWVMKEYGLVESWNKVCTFSLMGFDLEVPIWGKIFPNMTGTPTAICCRKSGEILLLMEELATGCLYSVDIEAKKIRDLRIGGDGYTWYLYSGYYSESLVLLDKASGLVSY